MELTQIREGVYSIDGCQPLPNVMPTLAVHPFYYSLDPVYSERFARVVADEKIPLVTLEQAEFMETSAHRYEKMGRSKNAFFIKTYGDQVPKEIEWPDIVDFLRLFGEGTIRLVGGHYNEKRPDCYCLGGTAKTLREAGLVVEVLKEITF